MTEQNSDFITLPRQTMVAAGEAMARVLDEAANALRERSAEAEDEKVAGVLDGAANGLRRSCRKRRGA